MRRWAPAVLLALAAGTACTGGAPQQVTAEVDGGSGNVALLGDVVVAAEPGGTVTVRHATEPAHGAEAPVTHALVAAAAAEALPPVFGRGGAGIVPNPAVWGPCRGGEAAAADGRCPAPAGDGPQAWDGRSYWSLGAMLPGEERELPLDDELADGDHTLICALHPQLRLVVRVGDAAPAAVAEDPEVRGNEAVKRAAQIAAATEQGVVLAGVDVDDPPAYLSAFAPDVIRVGVGESVTWRAGARTPVDVVFGTDEEGLSLSHTTPEDGVPAGDASGWDGVGELRSGFLSADPSAGASAAEWTVTFTRPGTYTYASRFADQIRGTVVVEEDAG